MEQRMMQNEERMKNTISPEALEARIGYHFCDKMLLETALTHASYSNENGVPSYERLEFLGDAVLQIVISRYLFDRFRDIPEGLLTKYRQYLVCESTLARIANDLSLERAKQPGTVVPGLRSLPIR